jgi:glycosyltransferase involved in cell wall biosynthesis
MDPVFGAFTLFYKYLYQINIHRNQFVVVQQQWLREQFSEIFRLDPGKILVAHPRISYQLLENQEQEKKVFFYPALPRVFKNHEIVCEAVKLLNTKGRTGFEVVFTTDGTENKYAEDLKERFGDTAHLVFAGLQPREKVFDWYRHACCLLFPSLLETWGLPISEFKQTGKPILLADRAYAHETLGTYDRALFFDPTDAVVLASKMESILDGTASFVNTTAVDVPQPMSNNWDEFFNIISRAVH